MELIQRRFTWIFLVYWLLLTFVFECEGQNVRSCRDMRGHSVQIGEVYHPSRDDPCVSCVCRLQYRKPDDFSGCMTVQCAAPPCKNFELIEGECCGFKCIDESVDVPLPITNNFTCTDFRGFTVNIGEQYNPSREEPCVDCECETWRIPGDFSGCITVQCQAPPCPKFEMIEGECCGFRCLNDDNDDGDEDEIDNRLPVIPNVPKRAPELTNPKPVGHTLPEQLVPCCNEGKRWYEESREQCSRYTGTFSEGTVEQKRRCKTIVDICCIQEREKRDCNRGVSAARIQGDCQGFQRQADREDATECCSCCLLGINAKNLGLSCDILGQNFTSRCLSSFTGCCTGGAGQVVTTTILSTLPTTTTTATTTTTIHPDDNLQLCEQFQDKLCEQICINTQLSYRCACREGFELHSDGRTCNKEIHQDQCDLNNPCDHICVDTGEAVRCNCFDGYKLTQDGFTCTDINECEDGTHNCLSAQACTNTVGSFTCIGNPTAPRESCTAGYAFNSVTQLCEDIDECVINRFACESDEECINNIGSYRCQPQSNIGDEGLNCGRGFYFNRDTRGCDDLNECELGTHRCLEANQKCRNTVGSFVCTCDTGYIYNRRTGRCEDLNECAVNYDTCMLGQTCINTVGSYRCRRTMSCGTGYTLDDSQQDCQDIDECLHNTHNCAPTRECRNIPGSFRCVAKTCPQGYRLNEETGTCDSVLCQTGFKPNSIGDCVDINECTEQASPCRPNQECHNTVGSYRCHNRLQCGPGYELNQAGTRCIDINECVRGLDDCTGPRMTCVNRRGTYLCECTPGFQMNHQTRRCEDINECKSQFGGQVCDLNAHCENTEGSFRCICNEGFEYQGSYCADINECDRAGMCQHTCRNIYGSFQCSCFEGYKLSADARTCEDIDECSIQSQHGGQLCVGTCRNTVGSYQCDCPDGYRMEDDGRACQDIDECVERTANCYDDNDQCINTRGGYKCETVHCPKGFIKAPTSNNRNKTFFSSYNPTLTTPPGPYNYRRDSLRSLTGPLPPIPSYDESTVACTRGECAPGDVDCILNTTKTIQWLNVALPTIPILTEPVNIVNMQTEGSNVYPNVRFLILTGNRARKFEVMSDPQFPDRGYLRLVQAIRGPKEYNLKLRMDHRNAFDYVVSSHIAFVKIYVSKYPY